MSHAIDQHSAVIFGLMGERLTEEEHAFFRDVTPWGYILFARNCTTPKQVRALTDELRALDGREQVPILIDQEGGRVARLCPPHWREAPPAANFVARDGVTLDQQAEAVYLNARLIAAELHACGITVDCAPLLDIPAPNSHEIIGDRAFASDVETVIRLGRSMAEGLLDGGVLPIIKHIPGHGRAPVDSHESLPVVDAPLEDLRATDFPPFHALRDLPMAMTAHVCYTAIDEEELATCSHGVIELIRTELAYDGLLMSDDLSMKAMKGDFSDRTKATLDAGCDMILHCNGDMEEMQAIASALRPLQGDALRRAEAVTGWYRTPGYVDKAAAEAVLAPYMKEQRAA